MNRIAVVASIGAVLAACVGESEVGVVGQAVGSGSGSGSGSNVNYAAYFTRGSETDWVFDDSESLEAAGYDGPTPTQALASTPALKNTVQSCTQFLAVPDGLVVVPVCNANDDIDCKWVAVCAFVYADIPGCDGNCFSQSTAAFARKTTALTNSATGAIWRATVCAAAISTGVATAVCWEGKPLSCKDYWPAVVPTTKCT